MTRQDGSGTEIDEDALATRVSELVKRGLERYGAGDLVGALSEWEHALSLSPDDGTAQQYVRYVRSNFDLLDSQFQQAHDVAMAAAAEGVPVGDDDDDYDEYEAFELTSPGDFLEDEGSVDEGWVLDDFPVAEPLPPTPDAMRAQLGPGFELLAESFTGVPSGEIGDGSAELAASGETLPEPAPEHQFSTDRAPTVQFEPARNEMDFSDLNSLLEDSGEASLAPQPSGEAQPMPAPSSGEDDGSDGPTDRGAAIDVHRAPTVDGSPIMAELAEESIDIELAPPEASPPEASPRAADEDLAAEAADTDDGDNDSELTVPGGEEPPPLPDRPALSEDALAAMEAAVEDMINESASESGASAHGEAGDFDESDLGHLDGAAQDDRAHDGELDAPRVTFHDVGTSERTVPSRPSMTAMNAPDMDLGEAAQLMEEPFRDGDEDTNDGDEATRERPSRWPEGSPVIDDIDEEMTRDHVVFGHEADLASQRVHAQRAPTEDPMLREQAVIIDDSLLEDATGELPVVRADSNRGQLDALRGLIEEEVVGVSDEDATRELNISGMDGPGHDEFGRDTRSRTPISRVQNDAPEVDAVRAEVVAAQLDAEVELEAPEVETDDERTRRRVATLIERAEQEFEAERYPVAVAALDLALSDRPDSAIAQKLIHGRRELLFRIFEAYLGDDRAVPMVALPTHEIAVQELDSRAAFLLSRIDGMLTFEEILDVAGMGKMEAYRHLCRLLLRGILEVR